MGFENNGQGDRVKQYISLVILAVSSGTAFICTERRNIHFTYRNEKQKILIRSQYYHIAKNSFFFFFLSLLPQTLAICFWDLSQEFTVKILTEDLNILSLKIYLSHNFWILVCVYCVKKALTFFVCFCSMVVKLPLPMVKGSLICTE